MASALIHEIVYHGIKVEITWHKGDCLPSGKMTSGYFTVKVDGEYMRHGWGAPRRYSSDSKALDAAKRKVRNLITRSSKP